MQLYLVFLHQRQITGFENACKICFMDIIRNIVYLLKKCCDKKIKNIIIITFSLIVSVGINDKVDIDSRFIATEIWFCCSTSIMIKFCIMSRFLRDQS